MEQAEVEDPKEVLGLLKQMQLLMPKEPLLMKMQLLMKTLLVHDVALAQRPPQGRTLSKGLQDL